MRMRIDPTGNDELAGCIDDFIAAMSSDLPIIVIVPSSIRMSAT
ncbi:MAG TPA: hypothetical protein VGQ55_00410 [Pyrinomonadaceae bacterium]|jgi:hypothetical protein|nr:hypothetical protein [Pyrinomonadaceae bacterium]